MANYLLAALRCYGRQHQTSYRKNPAFRRVAEAAIGLSFPHLDERLLDEVDRRVFCLKQGVLLQAALEAVLHRRHDRSLLNAAKQACDDGDIAPHAVAVALAASAARHQKWSSSRSKRWFPTRPPGIWKRSEPCGLPLQTPPSRSDPQDLEEYGDSTPHEVMIHPLTSTIKDKIEMLSLRFVELAQRVTEVRSVSDRIIMEHEASSQAGCRLPDEVKEMSIDEFLVVCRDIRARLPALVQDAGRPLPLRDKINYWAPEVGTVKQDTLFSFNDNDGVVVDHILVFCCPVCHEHQTMDDKDRLPPGWTRYYTTDEGKQYFHNAATDTTQWDRPQPPPLFPPLCNCPALRETEGEAFSRCVDDEGMSTHPYDRDVIKISQEYGADIFRTAHLWRSCPLIYGLNPR